MIDCGDSVTEQRAPEGVAHWLENRVPSAETRPAGLAEWESACDIVEAAQADDQLYQTLVEQVERWVEAVTTWEIARKGYRGGAKATGFLSGLVAYIEQLDAELSQTVAAIHAQEQDEHD